VLKRWIRPGIGGPTSHYWTHSTKGGGSVFNIAEGLRQAKGPYKLQVSSLESLLSKFGEQLRIDSSMPEEAVLTVIESYLIRELRPIWNH